MTPQTLSEKYPQYYKNVAHLTEVDVYQVHDLFDINDRSGAIHHASKKLLLAGVRNGGKPAIEDIREARDSLNRYLAIQESKGPAPVPGLHLVIDNTKPPMWLSPLQNIVAQASNDPVAAPTPASQPVHISTNKWVVLYYHQDTDRRYSPEEFYAMADTQKEAVKTFRETFPKAETVWVEKVHLFKEGAAEARRKYWASR